MRDIGQSLPVLKTGRPSGPGSIPTLSAMELVFKELSEKCTHEQNRWYGNYLTLHRIYFETARSWAGDLARNFAMAAFLEKVK